MTDLLLVFIALLGIGVIVSAALHLVLTWHRKKHNHEGTNDD